MSPGHQWSLCTDDNGAFQESWGIWVFQAGISIFFSYTSSEFLPCCFSLLFCCPSNGRDIRMFAWQVRNQNLLPSWTEEMQTCCSTLWVLLLTTGLTWCGRGWGRHGQLAGGSERKCFSNYTKIKTNELKYLLSEQTHWLCRQDLNLFHCILLAKITKWPFIILYCMC